MAVTASRVITIEFTGDVKAANSFQAANNVLSPGQVEIKTLSVGNNTITPPNITSVSTPKCCTIIPPSANAIDITLKGVAGDTGIVLHNTDPTSIALDSPSTTFVLSVGTQVDGVRLVWT